MSALIRENEVETRTAQYHSVEPFLVSLTAQTIFNNPSENVALLGMSVTCTFITGTHRTFGVGIELNMVRVSTEA